MAALKLHHALFNQEKDFDLPLHSATPFLHSAPERERSSTGHLFASAAYQDLIQRQPTHPDGPASGWDLGLNLLGDPITASEHKTLQDHQIKARLRRLHAINIVFELLFGIWGTYATIRYFLAFGSGLDNLQHIYALALGVLSALAVALVIMSISMSLLPQQSHPRAWRYTRSFLRTCYLLLLCAAAVTNLILVLLRHPSQLCSWDLDVSWYTSAVNTATHSCHTAPFSVWMVAATLRLVVTSTMALSFIYTLRSFHGIRHPKPEKNSPKYSLYLPSGPECMSPILTSSPLGLSKSTLRFARSEDSTHTLNQFDITLPKSSSISTLAPSTSCTGHSRSHSTPPKVQDITPPRISPPTSRKTSTSNHVTNHGPSQTQSGVDTPFRTQPVSGVAATSLASHMLRRSSRISVTPVTSDTMLPDAPSRSERLNGPASTRDSSEIRSSAPWKSSHRGSGSPLDTRKITLPWENIHARHTAQLSLVPESSTSTHDGESIKEKSKHDDVLVYSYGYGASEPTYPYLDMYNPQQPGGYAETLSSCEDVDAHELSQGHRHTIPSGPAFSDVSSEPRSSLCGEEESSGEEEEYVAMMGGFVRRMATIESLGSREAAGTLSTTTGSVARRSMRSRTPASQFSSVRFAEYGSSGACSSLGVPLSTEGSLSTAYLSFSSGGTGTRVNERGELLFGYDGRGTSGSSYDCHYYTASRNDLPRMDDGDR